MNWFVVVFLAGISSQVSGLSSKQAELGDTISELINATINDLVNGLDDPLTLNSSYEKFNNVILTGWLNTSNVQLTGLHSIYLPVIDVNYEILGSSTLNLTLSIGDLNLFGEYETSLLLLELLPFSGKGNVSANIDQITVKLYTEATISLIPFNISNFKNTNVDLVLGSDSYIKIGGLYYDDDFSEIVNEVLEDVIPKVIEFVDAFHDNISNVISPILQSLLDSIFN